MTLDERRISRSKSSRAGGSSSTRPWSSVFLLLGNTKSKPEHKQALILGVEKGLEMDNENDPEVAISLDCKVEVVSRPKGRATGSSN